MVIGGEGQMTPSSIERAIGGRWDDVWKGGMSFGYCSLNMGGVGRWLGRGLDGRVGRPVEQTLNMTNHILLNTGGGHYSLEYVVVGD